MLAVESGHQRNSSLQLIMVHTYAECYETIGVPEFSADDRNIEYQIVIPCNAYKEGTHM